MPHFGCLLEFRSTAFPADSEDEELVNSETMYGHALASYIAGRLPERGLKVSNLVAEDWGWYCELENDGFRLWYGVCNSDENSFLIQFGPDKPFIRRWFKKLDVSRQVTQMHDAVFAILSACEEKLEQPKWIGG